MTGRERFLTAIANKKPDRLPVQVHSWMEYYLNRYLNGMDQYQAYEAVGMSRIFDTHSPKKTAESACIPGILSRFSCQI